MIRKSGLGKLNERAVAIVQDAIGRAEELKIRAEMIAGAEVVDFGVNAEGGIAAGITLSRICMAGLAEVSVRLETIQDDKSTLHRRWPQVCVTTDHPLEACLLSQYAGWQVAVGKFFAMGSGPMRAVAVAEPLFEELAYQEAAPVCVGVLETSKMPTAEVIVWLCERLKIEASQLILCVARTGSAAGTLQIVARSVETALHKLHELKFDLSTIQRAIGTAPLPPCNHDDFAALGCTNDALLYGGTVMLMIDADDAAIDEVGPRSPSGASSSYGKPFLRVFEEAGGNFYNIDPALFSPAEILFQNVRTGRCRRFGHIDLSLLGTSFQLT